MTAAAARPRARDGRGRGGLLDRRLPGCRRRAGDVRRPAACARRAARARPDAHRSRWRRAHHRCRPLEPAATRRHPRTGRRWCCCASRAVPPRPRPPNSAACCPTARWWSRCKTASPTQRWRRPHALRLTVRPGMVPFNVVELGPGRYHRGTSGTLAAQDHPALRAWQPVFAAAGVPLDVARRPGAAAVGQAAAQPEQPGQCAVGPAAARAAAAARPPRLHGGTDRRGIAGVASRRHRTGQADAAAAGRVARPPCGCRRRSFGCSRFACCASTPRRAPAWPTTWRAAAAPRSTRCAARWCGWPRRTA